MIPRVLIFALAAAALAVVPAFAQAPSPKPSPSAGAPRPSPSAAPKTVSSPKPLASAPATKTAASPVAAAAKPSPGASATAKPYQEPPVPPHPKMTMAEFLNVHGSGKHILIDVRSLESYRESHIPGSISLPLMYLEERADTVLKKTKAPVVAYCACPAEETSARAANLLEEKGYKAAALVGGLNSWVLEGQPLVAGDVVGTWTPPAAPKATPTRRGSSKSRKAAPAAIKKTAPVASKPYSSTPIKPSPSPSPRPSPSPTTP